MKTTFLCIAIALVFGIFGCPNADAQDLARSDDMSYRTAMAKAVRAAADRFLPSIVTVEIIGAVGGAGNSELEQDAPTSGVLVDDEGYVIASSIVLRKPSASLLVVLPDGSRHVATPVAQDQHRSLALLKIKTVKQLTAVSMDDELTVRVGQTTVAVGRYGSGASPMVSTGVLSATERLDGIALQTDARVSPPLYGGALIDLSGNFLGVLVPAVPRGGAPDATSWYDSGIAFAIPADVLKKKLDRLKAGEDIDRGLIGIVPKSDDPLKAGTELAAVRMRSPAEKAGLKPGDRIISVDEVPVRRFQQIRQVLGRFDAGEKIAIEYKRGDDAAKRVEIELAESIPPLQPQRLGFIAVEASVGTPDSVADESGEGESREETETNQDSSDDETDNEDIDRDTRGKDETDEQESIQVIVDAVVPNSSVDGKLESGDVVLKLDSVGVTDVQSMRRLLVSAEPEKSITISILRDGKVSDVSVTPVSIEGDVAIATPEVWQQQSKKEWTVSELKLPEEGNSAAFVGPSETDDVDGLGLLVMLLNPGQGTPKEVLESWPNLARKYGVVVCAIAPSENERWRPKEIDAVSKFVAAVLKKAPIEKSAVAVAAAGALDGGKAEAADSMALAVAISASETFFGVAISHEARAPAVRLRENEADASLQIMLPISSEDELPTWAAALKKAGYPIIFGGATQAETLLKWVRLLQAI